jgi:hypothetical protein
MRFWLEVVAWALSIGCSLIMMITVPDVPLLILYPMWVVGSAVYTWAAWTRGSFGTDVGTGLTHAVAPDTGVWQQVVATIGSSGSKFYINIHLSGRAGAAGFDRAWTQLSPELRGWLTLENDEFQAGLDQLLPLSDRVAIVLDIHHHFIHSGQYIQPNDARIAQVCDSWGGARPVIHYSQSPWHMLQPWANQMPTLEQLTQQHPRGRLRRHSDFYNHRVINQWALEHLSWADCQTESKGKNISARQLWLQYKGADAGIIELDDDVPESFWAWPQPQVQSEPCWA